MKRFVCSFTSYQDNTTPLFMASKEGHHDIVQTLLGAGADLNITQSNVSDGMFYLHVNESELVYSLMCVSRFIKYCILNY